jgi:hypothetical protein
MGKRGKGDNFAYHLTLYGLVYLFDLGLDFN